MNEKLFINLKILANIQKNGKIARSHNGVISLENDSYLQPIRRFVNSDSRKQAIYEIKSIIKETDAAFINIFQSRHYDKYSNPVEYNKLKDVATMLYNELEMAKTGIENLKFTYISDLNTSSQLDILIMRTQTILKNTGEKLGFTSSGENENVNLIPI